MISYYGIRVWLATCILAACAGAAGQSTTAPQEAPSPHLPRVTLLEQVSQARSSVLFNVQDADAWLQLYMSARYAAYGERSRRMSPGQASELGDILARMDQHVPNSFAWNVAHYLHMDKQDEGWKFLEQAYAMDPGRTEIWEHVLCMETIRGRNAEAKAMARRMEQAGLYSPAILEYSRNVLRSVEPQAVLVTHGAVDTYPLLMLQKARAFRTDVTVICLEWAGSALFLQQVETLTGTGDASHPRSRPEDLLATLAARCSRPLYLALTLPPDMLRLHEAHLYCTGLAMKFSNTDVANLEALQHNWTKLFTTDHLRGAEPLNRNYLVPLVLLSDYLEAGGQSRQARHMREMARQVAAAANQTSIAFPYIGN